MTLRLIATGGTFDKVYDPLNGELRFTRSHLPDLLARARLPAGRFVVEELMLMDSLDMTDRHRHKVVAACRASAQTRIVVIHGTDTMVQTAAVLAAATLPATIVLTGAMVPYTIDQSDALFNLGHAIGCAQLLPAGVYVAMNGQAHGWDRARKNRELGVFEAAVDAVEKASENASDGTSDEASDKELDGAPARASDEASDERPPARRPGRSRT